MSKGTGEAAAEQAGKEVGLALEGVLREGIPRFGGLKEKRHCCLLSFVRTVLRATGKPRE